VPARLDGLADRAREPVRAGIVRDVREPPREVGPLLLAEAMAREVVGGAARERTEAVVVERVERRADDPEARRHQARLGEVQETRKKLAPREIAGRSE